MPPEEKTTVFEKAPGNWRGSWHVHTELPPALVSLLEDFPALEGRHDCSVVKSNRVRTVFRAQTEDGAYYIKHFHPRGLRERLKTIIRGGRASRESRSLLLLSGRSLPVPELIAHSVAARGHGALITRSVGSAVCLWERLQQPTLPKASRALELVRTLARVIGRLHACGAVHRDLHAGNILLLDSGRFVLLDFHKLSFPPFSRGGQIRDLAQLFRSLHPLLTKTRRLAFLRSYLAETGRKTDLRCLWKKIRRQEDRQDKVRLRSRTRRCMLDSTLFTRGRTERGMLWRRRAHPISAILDAISAHEGREGSLLKHSARSDVRVVPWPGPGGEVIVKERRSFFREKLQDLFYRGRSRQAWIAALGMEVRGIGTPPAYALLEERRLGILQRAFLLTEHCSEHALLDTFLVRELPRLSPAAQGDLLEELGRQIGRLHARGVYHRDLKPCNLLARRREEGRLEILFLDLDDTFFWRRLSWRRRCGSLAQLAEAALAAGVSLRMSSLGRFLRGYFRENRSMTPHRRRLWRDSRELFFSRLQRRRLRKGGPGH